MPILSPAWPASRSLRNISTPVTTFFIVSRKPTISISSPTFTIPRSTRPVTTVPRPDIVKMSSIGIRKSLSTARSGNGTYSSTAFINSKMHFTASLSASSLSKAFNALPRTIGISSPGNSYFDRSSRSSSSTSSINSSSSIMSTLFKKTTMQGTPTWRASNICSRV